MAKMQRLNDYNIDPPEDEVCGYCDHCGGEIYKGEIYYRIDGENIHKDCLAEFAEDYFEYCREEAEEI